VKDVTLGIITWKSKDLLEQLLDSIRSTTDGVNHETIVLDNNSEDGTIEMVEDEYPEVKLLKNPLNEGVAPARNKVFRAASARYILILDVDTKVLPGAIKTLVEMMDAQPDAAIGGPKLVYGDGRLQLSCRPFPSILNIAIEGTFLRDWFPNSRFVKGYTMEDWDHNDTREVDWMYGASLIIRQNALDKIGLFDEDYFYLYEDVDLCFRAKKMGYKVMYFPQAKIIHFLERERKGVFHPRIGTHIKSIYRYLMKTRWQAVAS
jgi:GT2 family glycosyltransferase